MPNLNRTWGFEAEWQTNAGALAGDLYRHGLTECSDLHYYHCGCEACHPYIERSFYAQNDSSCSGEIISRVHTFDPSAMTTAEAALYDNEPARNTALFDDLSAAAYRVDAEPGQRAGFHVHVGTSDLTSRDKANTLAAVARWERVLGVIAAGREQGIRSYNEALASQILGMATLPDGVDALDRVDKVLTLRDTTSPVRERMLSRMERGGFTRASYVNGSTGHGTWEFRLWNSTRAPWRMEMYVRTSIALCDPEVARWMMTATKGVPSLRPRGRMTETVLQRGIDRLACGLHDLGHEEAAVLLDRQRVYRSNAGWEGINSPWNDSYADDTDDDEW